KIEKSDGKLMAVINNYKRDDYLIVVCGAVVLLLFLVIQIGESTSLMSVILNFIILMLCVQLEAKSSINGLVSTVASWALMLLRRPSEPCSSVSGRRSDRRSR